MSRDAASPETVPRDISDETIIQDTPERRLAVLGEIDEAYGRDVRAGARNQHDAPRAAAIQWSEKLEAAGLFGPRPLDALADCCLRLLEKVAPHVPRGDRSAATPPAPKRGLDDHDSEVARALLRGKHGFEDDPHRTVSPTDVTSDIYA